MVVPETVELPVELIERWIASSDLIVRRGNLNVEAFVEAHGDVETARAKFLDLELHARGMSLATQAISERMNEARQAIGIGGKADVVRAPTERPSLARTRRTSLSPLAGREPRSKLGTKTEVSGCFVGCPVQRGCEKGGNLMRGDRYGPALSFFILAIIANLCIAISTENAYAQTAEELVSPALRIGPLPQEVLELEELDTLTVEECVTSEYRCINGIGNNIEHPDWGAANITLLRMADPRFGGDKSGDTPGHFGNARQISNILHNQEESVLNAKGVSDFFWLWGQFLDHDIDLTPEVVPVEEFNIEIEDDEYFGDVDILFNRSVYAKPKSRYNNREVLNLITAFIDGSNVYGSDEQRASALREFDGGRLLTSEGNLLPFNTLGLPNAGGTGAELFLAGDVRANEHAGLTALHTLFVREHNRLAGISAAENDEWDDEKIYQETRRLIAGQIQAITYNEFLPLLIGRLPKYKGYNSKINPGIANSFSTAAYRFGHSMLNATIKRLPWEEDCDDAALRDLFFAPDEITRCGIESILAGFTGQRAQEIDIKVVHDARNFLFGDPGFGGFDLAALNIQRGMDHGLPDINGLRQAYGLKPWPSFDELTNDPFVVELLREAFDDGKPGDCHPWSCGLAEAKVKNGMLGETFHTVVADQFVRLRDGDRYFYLNDMDLQEKLLTSKQLFAEHGIPVAGDTPFLAPRERGRQK